MSFGDRLRAWFKGESKRSAPGASTSRASKASTRELTDFVESRAGVEAFLEPRTALYSTTVLLVAADGEYLRRPIGDPQQAAAFCERHEIPLYDARKVGYPRRMHDYEAGRGPQRIELDDLPPWPGDEPDSPPPGDAGPPAGPPDASGSDDADASDPDEER